MKIATIIAACALLGSVGLGANGAELSTKKALNLAAAKEIAAAAEAEAVKNKWNVVIAIVDDGGKLLYLQRMDGTQWGSVDVATQKAQTAIGFKRATKVFEDAIAGGRNALISLASNNVVLPLEGGVPITAGDQIIGAIGVSGVTSQQDGVVAKAGADSAANLK